MGASNSTGLASYSMPNNSPAGQNYLNAVTVDPRQPGRDMGIVNATTALKSSAQGQANQLPTAFSPAAGQYTSLSDFQTKDPNGYNAYNSLINGQGQANASTANFLTNYNQGGAVNTGQTTLSPAQQAAQNAARQFGEQNGWIKPDGGIAWGIKDAFLNPAVLAAAGGAAFAPAGSGGSAAMAEGTAGGTGSLGAGSGGFGTAGSGWGAVGTGGSTSMGGSGLGGSSGTVGGSAAPGAAGEATSSVGANAGIGSFNSGLASPAASNSAGFGGFSNVVNGVFGGGGTPIIPGINNNALGGMLGLGYNIWNSQNQKEIADNASSIAQPLNQPQRKQYQDLLESYYNGTQDITQQPMVASELAYQKRAAQAKIAQMGLNNSGNALQISTDYANEGLNKTALPYLQQLAKQAGFDFGSGDAGSLLGKYDNAANNSIGYGLQDLFKGLTMNGTPGSNQNSNSGNLGIAPQLNNGGQNPFGDTVFNNRTV